mmetsp:Transcript_27348/g.61157  ORF Transcript_27348/g.61157 Transcript_27348/m.61157 type:complete len:212 (-) Transcript_27348:104-739(-)
MFLVSAKTTKPPAQFVAFVTAETCSRTAVRNADIWAANLGPAMAWEMAEGSFPPPLFWSAFWLASNAWAVGRPRISIVWPPWASRDRGLASTLPSARFVVVAISRFFCLSDMSGCTHEGLEGPVLTKGSRRIREAWASASKRSCSSFKASEAACAACCACWASASAARLASIPSKIERTAPMMATWWSCIRMFIVERPEAVRRRSRDSGIL